VALEEAREQLNRFHRGTAVASARARGLASRRSAARGPHARALDRQWASSPLRSRSKGNSAAAEHAPLTFEGVEMPPPDRIDDLLEAVLPERDPALVEPS
jgi:hypothetical protein